MKRLFALTLAVTALGLPRAGAGPLVSGGNSAYNYGYTYVDPYNPGPGYNDWKSGNPSTLSTASYTSPSGDITLSGTSGSSATVTTNLDGSTTIQGSASVLQTNLNTGQTGQGSLQEAAGMYSASITLDGYYKYTFNASGTYGSSSTASSGTDSSYNEVYLQRYGQYGTLAGYEGSTINGVPQNDTRPVSLSGTLAPGTYSLQSQTFAFNNQSPGSSGTISQDPSLNFSLTLTPTAATPEPASLTLLGLGGLGLAGYGWRRRRLSVSA